MSLLTILTIDELRVQEEMLRADEPQYNAGSLLSSGLMPMFTVASTAEVFAIPVTPDYRAELLVLRRRIEESGVTLKNAEELEKELDEMRGRT